MRLPKILFVPMIVLIIAILACNTPTSGNEDTVDAVATSVAATAAALQAERDQAPPTETPPLEVPTEEPAPEPPPEEETPGEEDNPPAIEDLPEHPIDLTLKVVYIDAGNLWLWKEDGTHLQLTDTGNASTPAISPDGRLVAYVQNNAASINRSLWVVNLDGSNNREVVSTAALDNLPRNNDALTTDIGIFRWVPDSHTLAYNTRPLYEGPGLAYSDDLRLYNVDNGDSSVLLAPESGSGLFSYSPDGSQIALVGAETITLINADGTNRREVLQFPFIYTYSEWQFYPQVVWSADSSALRVAIPPQDPLADANAPTVVWHIPTDGSPASEVTQFVAVPAFADRPLISPDTQKIIYAKPISDAPREVEINFLDFKIGESVPVHKGNLFLVNWNPDSARFVFEESERAMMAIIGVPPSSLNDDPQSNSVSWVDTERYIYISGSQDARELRLGFLGVSTDTIAATGADFIPYDFHPRP